MGSNAVIFRSTALFAIGACLLAGGCKKKEMHNPLLDPPEVEVAKVTTGDVPIFREWIGTIDGSYNAAIRSRVSGYIISQVYKDGSAVKKGDVLFEIDPRPFEAALAQAKADLSQAEADQVKTQLTADRYIPLAAQKAVSEQDRDTAVQQNEAAKARIEAQKAQVQQAELNLEFTKIVAPVDGVASIANRGIGDLVGPGDAQPLVTISTVDPVRVYFQISEQAYLKVAEAINSTNAESREAHGPQIELILADGSTYPHKGRLIAVDRQVDTGTGTIRLAGEFTNPGNILRPGQFARVRIQVANEKDVLLVPQQAVQEVQGSYQVAVVKADKTAEIRQVKTGPRFGPDWVLTEGVKPGEEVVVEGVQKATNGRLVVPRPYAPKAAAPAAPQAEPVHDGGAAPKETPQP